MFKFLSKIQIVFYIAVLYSTQKIECFMHPRSEHDSFCFLFSLFFFCSYLFPSKNRTLTWPFLFVFQTQAPKSYFLFALYNHLLKTITILYLSVICHLENIILYISCTFQSKKNSCSIFFRLFDLHLSNFFVCMMFFKYFMEFFCQKLFVCN